VKTATKRSQPPEVERVLRFLPEKLRGKVNVKAVEYGVPQPYITTYVDEERTIGVREGETEDSVPDYAFVHELGHNVVDMVDRDGLWPVLWDWAKARGNADYIADVKAKDLSDATEERFVQDYTTYCCGDHYRRLRVETPITPAVRAAFDRHWAR
jgi:hypothetical protein